MSEESIKRFTKKHRGSEREGKGLKAKNDRKSGTAENSHATGNPCEGHQCLDPSIAKLQLMKDSTLTRGAGDQLSRTSSNMPSKVKVSRKRKRTDRDAVLDDSVDFETDATELSEPQRNKKRDEYREEDRMPRLPYPDPAIDESLSEQSRRALSYAYERCRGIEVWKFNKARQNWLLRNVWSEQAVPDNYIPLVIRYLVGVRGGAREKLIGECTVKMPASEEAPIGAQLSDDSTKVGSTINQQPSTSRALSILRALHKSS